MQFSGLCLMTCNVLGLVKFYEEIFTTKAEGDAVHASLWIGRLNLAIFSREGMEKMAPGSMEDAGYGSFTLGFEVDDVDASYQRVVAFGVKVVKHPETHPWGTRSFWFRDPDGNIINFWQNAA